MPAHKKNEAANLFLTGTNASDRVFPKAVSLEKGASALGSSVPYWPSIGTNSGSKLTALPRTSPRAFANDKGATALMLILAPEIATDLDQEAQLLETVRIPPEALRALAVERALNVKTYLLQTGKVEARRITDSAQGNSSKGSRVYVRLQ